MPRWAQYLVGVMLLGVPIILDVLRPQGTLESAGASSSLPGWMHLSVSAGPYLLNWGPVLVGLLIIYYASRNQR